ncbi:Tryptophanyl-tRNA synthetase [Blumeria hordei DH14]|uniref:Tryptophan--tRNA ligase, cytoplasmic n=1 Tax=Blumeria graminis f. sp. hordei (strain DH14) TaxID=546991 RepID=N1JKT2_BLUG1|nr:Tryptophanyl-tRNA synthetase [Blumeria hordei DH14]
MADPKSPDSTCNDTTSTKKQTVDPYNVIGEIGTDGVAKAINYQTLIEEFGTKKILEADLARFEQVTGHKPHRFMRRGIVFSHRDLNLILDRHEKGMPFFLYTGRGPSSESMHIGHTVPFEFTKWLQDVFDVPLIIMLTDDEKYIFGEKRTIEEVQGYTRNNAKDIIAVGFDPKKTFMFSDYEFMGGALYRNVTRISKHITLNVARAVFGFNDSSCIGKVHFGAVQGATSFASSFPHIFGEDENFTNSIPSLIPCAIDQDPYFRLTRDVAARLHFAKPSLIHSRFLDALQGPGSKMSASIDTSAIFMKDMPSQIKNKINRYAFSGGQTTEAEQRALGGDPEKDVSFQYLTFFLEDDAELERIRKSYINGEMLTGELKALCIRELQSYVKDFQERRALVNDETVQDFMARKPLTWHGNSKLASQINTDSSCKNAKAVVGDESEVEPGKMTKNQAKKLAKMKKIAEGKMAIQSAKEEAVKNTTNTS